jgi:hypothetical protein
MRTFIGRHGAQPCETKALPIWQNIGRRESLSYHLHADGPQQYRLAQLWTSVSAEALLY